MLKLETERDQESNFGKSAGKTVSMGFDLDTLDDIFLDSTTKNTRAGGKFQPKARPWPRKESSASMLCPRPCQTVDIPKNKLAETLGTEKPSQSNEDSCTGVHLSDGKRSSNLLIPSSELVAAREVVDPIGGLHSGTVIPDSSGNWHSCFGQSAGENGDIYLGLESLGDFLGQPATLVMNTASRSSLEAGMNTEMENTFSSSFPAAAENSFSPSETAAIHGSRNSEEDFDVAVVSSVDDLGQVSHKANAQACPDLLAMPDPSTSREACASNNDGNFHIENRMVEPEPVNVFPSLGTLDIMSDLTTISAFSGQQTGKFQPKPKAQVHREKFASSIPNRGAVESVSCQQDAQLVHSETKCTHEGSIPVLPSDDILDLSSIGFGESVPMDLTSELPVNDEAINFTKIDHSGFAIPGELIEAAAGMPAKASQRAKVGKRKASTVSDLSPKHQRDSIISREDKSGRSLRQQRKQANTCQLVDESDDEAVDAGDFPIECPSGSVINEDYNNDRDYEVENESQEKGVQKRSKKAVHESDKPVRKRNKAGLVSEQSTKEHPKKFSHSTRQKRRRVDKALLETPEEEMQTLCLRDLIQLSGYRERILKKEATTSENPPMNKSAGGGSAQFNEDRAFASDQDGQFNDDQTNPRVEDSSPLINYQSYMNKTPRVKWSEQDTELFYEAVRQFGTDLSLIQQLFPGRTRKQIKLKYKKEERVNPFLLCDALTHRAKGHSHFVLVIERLKKTAAQERQNSGLEDSIGLADEEEEVGPPARIEEEVEDMEPYAPEDRSPVKSEHSEDDLFRWSQYKSEV